MTATMTPIEIPEAAVVVPVEDWKWYGMAAHFICAADCLFHMATQVGGYIVSTVGDLRLHEGGGRRGKRTSIGCDRDYETFVFLAGEVCTCGCGMPTIEGHEIDAEPANDPITARENHMAMCAKYARTPTPTKEASSE